MRFLPPNLAAVAKAASKSDTKYAISGVQYEEIGKRGFRIVATDTRVLAAVEGEGIEKHPLEGKLAACPNGATKALINREEWVTMLTASKEQKKAARFKPHVMSTGIAVNNMGENHFVAFMATDGQTERQGSVQGVQGRFPPYESVMPKGRPAMRISLGIEQLEILLSVAKAIGQVVIMDFFTDSKPAIIHCKSEWTDYNGTRENMHDQMFTGLIMPITLPDSWKLPKVDMNALAPEDNPAEEEPEEVEIEVPVDEPAEEPMPAG